MSVQTFGATAALVKGMLGNAFPGGFHAATNPDDTEVLTQHIEWAAAEVTGALGSVAAGLAATPTTSAYAVCQQSVILCAVAAITRTPDDRAACKERLEMLADPIGRSRLLGAAWDQTEAVQSHINQESVVGADWDDTYDDIGPVFHVSDEL